MVVCMHGYWPVQQKTASFNPQDRIDFFSLLLPKVPGMGSNEESVQARD